MSEPVPAPAPIADPTAAFQNLLKKHNDNALELAAQLYDENYRYRTQIRDLSGKTPKVGDLVLTGDDVKEYQAFKAFDMKAEDLKKKLDDSAELEKTNKELSGMEVYRELAELGHEGSKMKLSVLKDQLARYPEAKITFKTEKDKDGKEAKVAYIQKTDKEPVTPFNDFANAELADYLPSLKVSTEAQQPFIPGNNGDPAPNGANASMFDKIRENVKKEGETPTASIDARFGRPATV